MAHDYSIYEYGWMISHRERMDPIRQALQQAITPGCIVVDIGTGTGIFALLACQLGAGRVYAIEPSEAIQLARENAAANGFAKRVVCIQAPSTQVTLPERAKVIISELRGVLPFFEAHIPAIVDARDRFLAPGGVLIPWRDTLWAAVVTSPEWYDDLINPWKGNDYGLDLGASRQILTNSWQKHQAPPEQLMTVPQCWGTLDYAIVEDPDFHTELTWIVNRSGLAHGMILWFDAELRPGVGFSNAPDKPKLGYGNGFFPWSEPVDLSVGDAVSVAISADLVADSYIWRWDTHIEDQGGHHKADFQQSSFYGTPLSPVRLQQMAAGHVPELNGDGHIDRFILELMDGNHALGEIARQVTARFPGRFAHEEEALTRAGEQSLKYGRPLDRKYLREP